MAGDLRGNDRGAGYFGAGKPPRHVLPALGRRQPADMRGSDPCHAPLHLPVLPGACMRSAHDNTTNIVIEPVAAPTQGKPALAEFARTGCGIGVASGVRAVARRAVSAGGPLIEAHLSHRRGPAPPSLTRSVSPPVGRESLPMGARRRFWPFAGQDIRLRFGASVWSDGSLALKPTLHAQGVGKNRCTDWREVSKSDRSDFGPTAFSGRGGSPHRR